MGKTTRKPSDHYVQLTQGDALRPVDDVLDDVFAHAIAFCDGNKTQAAAGLGMGRTTFYRKIGAHRELLSQERKR